MKILKKIRFLIKYFIRNIIENPRNDHNFQEENLDLFSLKDITEINKNFLANFKKEINEFESSIKSFQSKYYNSKNEFDLNRFINDYFYEKNDATNLKSNIKKGHLFEKYVATLFVKNKKSFSIVSWQMDNYDKSAGINVEANIDPDLLIRFKPTNSLFAIECKFRSSFEFNKQYNSTVLEWAKDSQIRNYKNYSIKNKIPVYVIIGFSGEPDCPEKMYCIPIEEAKYSKLFLKSIKKFERDPKKSFVWKNGKLY